MLGSSVSCLDQRMGEWRGQSIGPLQGQFSPYQLANNAAVYSLSGDPSGSTYIIDGSNRLQLVADRSGNSAVNVIASNGSSGSNSISAANKTVTGNQVFTADIQLSTYTPANNVQLANKRSGNDGYTLTLLTTGQLLFQVGDGASFTAYSSTVNMSATPFVRHVITVTYVDGASGSATFAVDGMQLGAVVAISKTLTNAAVSASIDLTNLVGYIYRLQVGSVYDCNPALSAKLQTSFVSGGDTWTLFSSTDLGPRISGARDLVQLTQAKQPIWSTGSDGKNLATFDGSNDYMQSASFSLSQPETVYSVVSNVTAGANRRITDGCTSQGGMCYQDASGNVLLYAGSAIGPVSLGVGNRAVICGLFSGASSSVQINRNTPITGNGGNANMGGFTVGSQGNAANCSNITFSEAVLRSVADDANTQGKIVGYEMSKWSVPNFNLILDSSSQGINDSSGGVLFSPN